MPPHSVLRRVCDLFDAEGWQPIGAAELEYYLVVRNADPKTPLRPPRGFSCPLGAPRHQPSSDLEPE